MRRCVLSLLTALLCSAGVAVAADAEFFEQRVRPLLVKQCFACHTDTQMGGLRLDSRDAMLRGGKSGPAIEPGNPDASLLVRAVSHTHEKLKMPPGGRLGDEQVQDLVAWVRAGAVWPEAPVAQPKGRAMQITDQQRAYWSFQPVRQAAPPDTRNKTWPKTDIDRFVLAALEAKGLQPVRAADRRTLLRRAYFDLTGLPPKPAEVEALVRDPAPDAFAKVVDRLLASPHYGERWGRFWLDLARYSDDKGQSTKDEPYPNGWRYRDWVIQAFNEDMPYDLFVKAQIAGDQLGDDRKYAAGLGFYALSPPFQDDRVDVTTRTFLALTVACAQCHDHKYDPIPTKDFYALQGIFTSTQPHEMPLAPEDAVAAYESRKKRLEMLEKERKEFLARQTSQLSEILANQTSSFLLAARQVMGNPPQAAADVARRENLDRETLERWVTYLRGVKEHPHLNSWDELLRKGGSDEEARKLAGEFQTLVSTIIRDKKEIDEKNRLNKDKAPASLDSHKTILWKDLFFANPRPDLPYRPPLGIVYYGAINQYPDSDKDIVRFLTGEWRKYYDALDGEIHTLRKSQPNLPFLHTIRDAAKPANLRVHIGGSAENLGEEAPRRFLSILSAGEPPSFTKGSGRLELADSIADSKNPLTARVMVNRIWHQHFGAGIVGTPSNFGQLGDRPTNPELLDFLAARFIDQKWSMKSLHREIMLSAVYQLSSENLAKNHAVDAANRLLWRANVRRLDAESLRDSILFVSGKLDESIGGRPEWLSPNLATKAGPDGEADAYSEAEEWRLKGEARRTLYGYVSRRRPDATMALFDFPNPGLISEQRFVTSTPLQRLFFLNSDFLMRQAEIFADRLSADPDGVARVRSAYRLLFGREPREREIKLGLEFLESKKKGAWPEYAQILMSSNEFVFVR